MEPVFNKLVIFQTAYIVAAVQNVLLALQIILLPTITPNASSKSLAATFQTVHIVQQLDTVLHVLQAIRLPLFLKVDRFMEKIVFQLQQQALQIAKLMGK